VLQAAISKLNSPVIRRYKRKGRAWQCPDIFKGTVTGHSSGFKKTTTNAFSKEQELVTFQEGADQKHA
jgi:hypothetical protein